MCNHENKTTIINASNGERVVRCLDCGLTMIARDGKIDRTISGRKEDCIILLSNLDSEGFIV